MAQCEWCWGAVATTEVELEPAKYRIDKRSRKRVIAKFPKKVKACGECAKVIEAQMEQARSDKERDKKTVEPF
jgi:recombinational DNA repair protein RecR